MHVIYIVDYYTVTNKKEQDFKVLTLRIITTYLAIWMYCQLSTIQEALDKGKSWKEKSYGQDS